MGRTQRHKHSILELWKNGQQQEQTLNHKQTKAGGETSLHNYLCIYMLLSRVFSHDMRELHLTVTVQVELKAVVSAALKGAVHQFEVQETL